MKEQSIMKPLFAWVGGKQRLANQILPLVPDDFRAYHEPFCGSAALFLAMDLHKKDVFLNDKNTALITLHQALYSHPEPLRTALREIRAEYVKAVNSGTAREFFNAKRVTFNELKKAHASEQASVRLACLFLFLVKSSYGSLYS